MTDKNNKKKIQQKEKEFDELLENNKQSKEQIIYRLQNMKWEKLLSNKKGIGIRCQAILKVGEKNQQCSKEAIRGKLFCGKHFGKHTPQKKVEKEIQLYQQFGILRKENLKLFKNEIEQMEQLPREKLETLEDEIKVILAYFRYVLENYSDREIKKKPWLLVGRDGILSCLMQLKKTHHDIVYSPKVVFSRDAVETMFLKFKNVLIKRIKDDVLLQQIADDLQLIILETKKEHDERK